MAERCGTPSKLWGSNTRSRRDLGPLDGQCCVGRSVRMTGRDESGGRLIRWPSRARRMLRGSDGGRGCQWRVHSDHGGCSGRTRARQRRSARTGDASVRASAAAALSGGHGRLRPDCSRNAQRYAADQLIQDPRVDRGAVGGDLGRDCARAQRAGEEPPGCGQVTARG